MPGETDLARLLATMRPFARPGEYVLVTLPERAEVPVHALIREAEGVTHVIDRATADEHGWPYEFVAAWITLRVHSALEAVGLTAAVTAALAEAGIPANMLAGYYHDHVLVPVARVGDALAALERLSADPGSRSPDDCRASPAAPLTDSGGGPRPGDRRR